MSFLLQFLIKLTILLHFSLVVTVNFSQSLYSYSEDHGVVSDITVVLSTEIAQDLTVTVSGGDKCLFVIVSRLLL